MAAAVIFLMGPTASGKTDLAIELCRQHRCEIISVDSALIYRDMNIGTAKPSNTVLADTPHALLNIRNPDEQYSVAEFCNDANRQIDAILGRGHTPLLVGGTILYFRALQFGLSELPATNPVIRQQLEAEMQSKGSAALHSRLSSVDATAATRIHPNDRQRIQRALEVFENTGRSLTSWQQKPKFTRDDLDIHAWGLFPENRAWLHQDIEKRFDWMLEHGAVEELQALRQNWTLSASMSSMRCIGYRQIWSYLEGDISYAEMRDQGIAATRQLAKRQLTWLRSYPKIGLIDPAVHPIAHLAKEISCNLPASNC